MSVELDTKYEKICKKNNYDPEIKMRKKERKEIIIRVRHLRQAEMAYSKADATYAEIGDTKAISVHSEIMEILRTGKICKIHKIQTILQMHIKTKIL